VFRSVSNRGIIAGLITAVVLWGGNNTAAKHIVASWSPVFTGATRLLFAGLLMLALLRWTAWLGPRTKLNPALNRQLWFRGGLSLAMYIVAFNWALKETAASHVALYLGASPVWALMWEVRPSLARVTLERYAAAALALGGVSILLLPALRGASGSWLGEVLGFSASVLWAVHGRQARRLGAELSGTEVTAHSFWRAAVWLLPFVAWELTQKPLVCRPDLIWAQLFCVFAGAVIPFTLWNNALRHWPASRVFLFNNFIPVSTMSWAAVFLGEKVTPTFGLALLLIVAGVLLGQARSLELRRLARLLPD
jgi:drug/metabolite transporter (DMT)-like permease